MPERDAPVMDELNTETITTAAGHPDLKLATSDPRPTALVIPGMVTIGPGTVTLEPGVEPDDAARAFWDAVARLCPEGFRA